MDRSEMVRACCCRAARVLTKSAIAAFTLLLASLGAFAQTVNTLAAEPDLPEIPSTSMLVLVHYWPDDLPVEMPVFTSDSLMVYEVRVDAAGALQKFHRVSGSDELASYAEDFLLQVKFNSPLFDGKASGFKTTLGVCFSRELTRKVALCAVIGAGEEVSAATFFMDGKETEKRLIHRVPPEYPAIAKAARVQGATSFQVLIGTDGHVTDAKPASGPPLLLPAVQESIRKSTYRPLVFRGKPVRMYFTEIVEMNLPR
jgi:hypothetical protein